MKNFFLEKISLKLKGWKKNFYKIIENNALEIQLFWKTQNN